jgi:protein TonB
MHIKSYLAIAAIVTVSGPAQAAQQQRKSPVVVTAPTLTVDQWSANMTRSLERQLRHAVHSNGPRPNEGLVRVNFRCSEDGTPSAVALASSSGHRDLDRAALRVVSNIPTLHPLPQGITHDQRFAALILFANDQLSYNRQMAVLREDAARENASRTGVRTPLAMTIGLTPQG